METILMNPDPNKNVMTHDLDFQLHRLRRQSNPNPIKNASMLAGRGRRPEPRTPSRTPACLRAEAGDLNQLHRHGRALKSIEGEGERENTVEERG